MAPCLLTYPAPPLHSGHRRQSHLAVASSRTRHSPSAGRPAPPPLRPRVALSGCCPGPAAAAPRSPSPGAGPASSQCRPAWTWVLASPLQCQVHRFEDFKIGIVSAAYDSKSTDKRFVQICKTGLLRRCKPLLLHVRCVTRFVIVSTTDAIESMMY